MNEEFSNCSQTLNKIISSEEWEPIIKAIVAGKYSWACILTLHVIGLNPIEYIPYRTYMRLLKNNCILAKSSKNKTNGMKLQFFTIKSRWTELSSSKLE
ncbi:HetP family heterocyst commitment protein [Dendronalium sp. ChiSLP03b]|uniref:HetP family heterocyst commitment protein n=1 Tax=Dendronalium sp. ChiSLP03b TaxID=3075381 RepID=UPI002AD3EBB2|nr:HetP family heterocyst commitment protein [Dendronalium sp. ChiSLP03b]MDZ8203761.1 HetP family heterocyst commitment protein [Dendronalium sp. ChiSLP03b]